MPQLLQAQYRGIKAREHYRVMREAKLAALLRIQVHFWAVFFDRFRLDQGVAALLRFAISYSPTKLCAVWMDGAVLVSGSFGQKAFALKEAAVRIIHRCERCNSGISGWSIYHSANMWLWTQTWTHPWDWKRATFYKMNVFTFFLWLRHENVLRLYGSNTMMLPLSSNAQCAHIGYACANLSI